MTKKSTKSLKLDWDSEASIAWKAAGRTSKTDILEEDHAAIKAKIIDKDKTSAGVKAYHEAMADHHHGEAASAERGSYGRKSHKSAARAHEEAMEDADPPSKKVNPLLADAEARRKRS